MFIKNFNSNELKFPFAVTEAASGQQALEPLKKRRFHVLFTDIKMPFVDGLGLARQAISLITQIYIIPRAIRPWHRSGERMGS